MRLYVAHCIATCFAEKIRLSCGVLCITLRIEDASISKLQAALALKSRKDLLKRRVLRRFPDRSIRVSVNVLIRLQTVN